MSLRSFLTNLRSGQPPSGPDTPPATFTRGARLGVGTIRKAALSADGARVAVATSRGVALYDALPDAGPWPLVWFQPTEAWAVDVAFSGDGRRVAASTSQGRVTVRDVASGEEIAALEATGKTCVALDRQGRRAAVGDRAGVTLWDVASGRRERALTGTAQEITSVVFHPTRDQVAAADHGGHALLWDADTGREIRRWQGARPLRALAFDGDGAQLAAVGKDWTLWDIDTGLQVHTGTAPGPMISAAFSADGQRLVTGTARNRALLWDLDTGARARDLCTHVADVHSVAFAPGDAFLMLASQKLHAVHPAQGALLCTIPAFARLAHACASPDSALVAVADRQIITVWDRASGEPVAALDGHTHSIQGMWFRKGGAEILSHSPREIICWSARSGDKRYVIDELGSVGGASLSRDGALLAAAGEQDGSQALGLWNADTGERIRTLASLPRRGLGIHELALAPDGSALAVRATTTVTVYDVARGVERFRVEPTVNRAGALSWSPDSKTLAAGMQGGEVVLWDAASGRRRRALSGAEGGATGLVYSASGALLAGRFKARAGDVVLVWDAAGKRLCGPLPGGDAVCHALALSPDERTLVGGFSGGQETGLWVAWHLGTGEVSTSERGDAIWAAAFSPDGATLITGTGDGVATLWDVGAA